MASIFKLTIDEWFKNHFQLTEAKFLALGMIKSVNFFSGTPGNYSYIVIVIITVIVKLLVIVTVIVMPGVGLNCQRASCGIS